MSEIDSLFGKDVNDVINEFIDFANNKYPEQTITGALLRGDSMLDKIIGELKSYGYIISDEGWSAIKLLGAQKLNEKFDVIAYVLTNKFLDMPFTVKLLNSKYISRFKFARKLRDKKIMKLFQTKKYKAFKLALSIAAAKKFGEKDHFPDWLTQIVDETFSNSIKLQLASGIDNSVKELSKTYLLSFKNVGLISDGEEKEMKNAN